MATYEYRCRRDGEFDVTLPLGTAAARITCSSCGGEAVRVFSARVDPGNGAPRAGFDKS